MPGRICRVIAIKPQSHLPQVLQKRHLGDFLTVEKKNVFHRVIHIYMFL